jgi:hypothetical protein
MELLFSLTWSEFASGECAPEQHQFLRESLDDALKIGEIARFWVRSTTAKADDALRQYQV